MECAQPSKASGTVPRVYQTKIEPFVGHREIRLGTCGWWRGGEEQRRPLGARSNEAQGRAGPEEEQEVKSDPAGQARSETSTRVGESQSGWVWCLTFLLAAAWFEEE